MSPSEAPGAEFGPALNGLLAAQRTHPPTLNISAAASTGCACFNTTQWPIGHQGLRPRSLSCPMGMRSLRNLSCMGQWEQIPQESALLLHQLKYLVCNLVQSRQLGLGQDDPDFLPVFPWGWGWGCLRSSKIALFVVPHRSRQAVSPWTTWDSDHGCPTLWSLTKGETIWGKGRD